MKPQFVKSILGLSVFLLFTFHVSAQEKSRFERLMDWVIKLWRVIVQSQEKRF